MLDQEKVNRVRQSAQIDDLQNMSSIFKVLADQTRIRIVHSLSVGEELCVHDVAQIIDCSIATASHHLRTLQRIGIAKHRKEGKLVFYSLSNAHVKLLLEVMLPIAKHIHIKEKKS